MSMKHRRGNREAKKPKQTKPKLVSSVPPFAALAQSAKAPAGAKRR
jgi:hypothetical protein